MATGTPAGWYADPYGRHQHRYFDGEKWTHDVSDSGTQSTDDPEAGTPAVVPPSPFSRPAMATATAEPTVVVKHRSPLPWILLGIFVVMVVGVVGCVAVVSVGLDQAAKEIGRTQERHAISQAQFDSVQIGSPRDAVINALGKPPAETSSFESQAEGDLDLSTACIYYWESGETFGNWYQFCFDSAGNLQTKSQS
jgi:Protein of unknown function (DUF2510)